MNFWLQDIDDDDEEGEIVPEKSRLDELDPTHFWQDDNFDDIEEWEWPVYSEAKGG